MVHETADVLRLERYESQRSPSKTPFQKLPNEEPINRSCRLAQPRDLIQVPIILPTQALDA